MLNKREFFMVFITLTFAATIVLAEDKLIVARKGVDHKCLAILSNTTTERARCEFYKCFEERFPCGANYYAINLGYKYCVRYTENDFVKNFTETGQKLINQMVECLPKAFEKIYRTRKSVKCQKLMKESYDAQEKCYTDVLDTFCKGLPENKHLFRKMADISDVMTYDGMAMMNRMSKKCGQDGLINMAFSMIRNP